MKKRVIIIGGGVAGMQTALRLAEQGVSPVIIEKEAELGGKLRGWHVLFPSFTPAQEVLTELRRRVNESGIEVMTSTEVAGFTKESVTLADGRTLPCDSVVVASGFTLFDASIKEEYGYGIYDNVFTTADIERMLNEGRVAKADGSRPRRIAFLHCVGSRDEKVCQQHCSKVCCITGVKQAMEMKQLFPEADVFNFYMDIRMFGPGYEEMYREAQQRYNIHFLRGRISEASPTIDGRVQIKAEDTLTGRPLRMSVDMLVLIVGMQIGYGVMRRLNTANLSESVSVDTVSTALKGGLEWGNGFTQFPLDFTVDEADERTGTVEVTVLDTSSANELELLSNGQIQAAALATNALLNDKIDRVVYNVHAYIDEDSNIQHDSFFGMFPARGHQSAILTFVWTKSSSNATSIDWKMRIVSMDDTIAERIQKQVNSVSSLIEDPVVSQTKIDEEKAERDLEHRLHGREIFRGGKPDRSPSDLLEQDKQK